MKKLSKILIPIASAIAVAAPVTNLTSCSKNNFVCDKLDQQGPLSKLRSNIIDVEANRIYTVTVDLTNLPKKGKTYVGYILEAISTNEAQEKPEFNENLCFVSLGDKVLRKPPAVSLNLIMDDVIDKTTYISISFRIAFKTEVKSVYLEFQQPYF